MAKKWPPQDTGVFAVAFCVQCCTYVPHVPPDKMERRSSNASGYAMFGQPPPDDSGGVLYRTVSASGGFTVRFTQDCETFLDQSVSNYSGSVTRGYDGIDSGHMIGTAGGTVFWDGTSLGVAYTLPPAFPCGQLEPNAGATATTYWHAANADCCGYPGGEYNAGQATGMLTMTCSNPCVENDSIAYQEATYPGFSDWSEIPLDSPYEYIYASVWDAAPPGVIGSYGHSRVQFRRSKGGYTPGASYDCTMEVYRAAQNSYSFSLYATATETIVADATGTLVWEDDVPFVRGYKFYVKASSFTATPT